MSVFVGQNTGAKNQERVEEGYRKGQCMLAGFGLVMSVIMFVGAPVLLPMVLPEGEGNSLAPAMGYLRLIACFYLFNFLGSGLAGYYRGSGRVNLPVIGSTGHITFRVVASWLLAPVMGLPAVALASGLGWMGVVTFWTIIRRRLRKKASGAAK
jgi:Na+-driven multidrug efflux pump